MTTAENFRRVRNLFDAAMERPPAERGAFLADACEGIARLVACPATMRGGRGGMGVGRAT